MLQSSSNKMKLACALVFLSAAVIVTITHHRPDAGSAGAQAPGSNSQNSADRQVEGQEPLPLAGTLVPDKNF